MAGIIGKKSAAILSMLVLGVGIIFSGCGEQSDMMPQKTAVKAMKVIQQDAPITYGYPGQLKGIEDVEVHSRISGNIVQKYFKGGEIVQAGAPLYRLDARQYESAVIEAEATLHKYESSLRTARDELARYEKLWKDRATSEQTVVSKREDVASNIATVESQQAAVRKAKENLADAMVYAPMTGQVSVDDVAVGTYATAGTTKLVTIGSTNPIYAQFSISETEYLNILAKAMEEGTWDSEDDSDIPNVKLILSNGDEYPELGEITAVDRAFSDNSGSLTVKAVLPNPRGILLPGMFARVRFVGVVAKDAILVPQRAVQQLLEESFVMVVGEDGKSVSRNVVLGEKVGSYYVVKKGLTTDDTVIVDGLTSLQAGKDLDVTMVTAEEMGFSMEESADIVNKS